MRRVKGSSLLLAAAELPVYHRVRVASGQGTKTAALERKTCRTVPFCCRLPAGREGGTEVLICVAASVSVPGEAGSHGAEARLAAPSPHPAGALTDASSWHHLFSSFQIAALLRCDPRRHISNEQNPLQNSIPARLCREKFEVLCPYFEDLRRGLGLVVGLSPIFNVSPQSRETTDVNNSRIGLVCDSHTVWLRIVQIVVKLSCCICRDFQPFGTSATAHWDYFSFYLTTEHDHMS